MEKSGTFTGPMGPYIGGSISGIGIGVILMAAIAQYTSCNLANFTRLAVALGLIAVVIGGSIVHQARRKTESGK